MTMRARALGVLAVLAVFGMIGPVGAGAPPPAARPVIQPIAPCRLVDTRTTTHIGPIAGKLGANATTDLTVHGAVGNCAIPTSAVGIVANLTVVNQTKDSALTVFPTGTPRPTATSLSFTATGGATSNQVTALLGDLGQLSIYNKSGSTHVLIDLVAFFEDHDHDDRYYTEDESNAIFAEVEHDHDERYYTETEANARYVDAAGDTLTGPLTYATPQARQIVIGQSSFTPRLGSDAADLRTGYSGGGTWIFAPNDGLVADVQLPVGASVTSIVVSVRDTDTSGGADVSASLHRALRGTGFSVLATATSPATAGIHALTLTPSSAAAVNDTSSLQLLVQGAVSYETAVLDAVVNYTVTTP